LNTQKIKGRERQRNILLAILLLALLVVLIKACLVGRDVYMLWTHGMQLKALAYNPGALLQAEGPAELKANLESIEQALEDLQAQLRPVLRPAWLPWRAARENLLAIDTLFSAGVKVTQVGQQASDGLQAIVDAMEASDEGGLGASEKLFKGLVAARPYFSQAEQRLGDSCAEVSALTADTLWPPLSDIVPAIERYLQLAQAALKAAVAAPALLGDVKPMRYLILAQNNDELRATGGFITGIGLVTIDKGQISDLVFKDSYAYDNFTVDHPFAPEPMQRYMGIILWTTRDGNWSPDFPTAARDVEKLYYLENDDEIGAVVAFDMSALQALVGAIGPLELEGYQDRIDGHNVLQKIREYWAPQLPQGMTWEEWKAGQGNFKEWWVQRKDFMNLLARAIMSKLQSQDQTEQLSNLLWVLKQTVVEKHIQLYFHEPAVQELLSLLDMDGALDRNTQGDYLLVLDTNMGYNKVNLNVEKQLEYEITLDQSAAPLAKLTITYCNRSPAQPVCEHHPKWAPTYDLMAQDCYWNYLRVYVPAHSRLLAVEGVTDTETLLDAGGKTIFTTFLVVPASESRTIRFIYSIPDLQSKEYRLLVQKQAGTDAVPLTVRVVLPPGTHILSSQPEPQTEAQGVVSYDLKLKSDRRLILKLH